MSTLRQYDPVSVSGSWRGIPITEGVVSGEFFSTAQDNTLWTQEADLQGNVTRVKNNIRAGSFQLTLSASSPTNAALVTAYTEDQGGANRVGDMVLEDNSSPALSPMRITARNAYIQAVAEVSFGSERGSRVWTFLCTDLEFEGGGHEVA